MGALSYMLPRLRYIANDRPVLSVKRSGSASPATGSAKAHEVEQKTLLALAFTQRLKTAGIAREEIAQERIPILGYFDNYFVACFGGKETRQAPSLQRRTIGLRPALGRIFPAGNA